MSYFIFYLQNLTQIKQKTFDFGTANSKHVLHLDPDNRLPDIESNSISGHYFWPDIGALERAGYRIRPNKS